MSKKVTNFYQQAKSQLSQQNSANLYTSITDERGRVRLRNKQILHEEERLNSAVNGLN